MMEIIRETHHPSKRPASFGRASNDNRRNRPAFGRSVFPGDAVAHISKPSRSAMTSSKARMNGWLLVFERRSAPFIEPLMGYTGSNDTLTQVELAFPTLRSAIRYAERQGLTYVVQRPVTPSTSARRIALDKPGLPAERHLCRRSYEKPGHSAPDKSSARISVNSACPPERPRRAQALAPRHPGERHRSALRRPPPRKVLSTISGFEARLSCQLIPNSSASSLKNGVVIIPDRRVSIRAASSWFLHVITAVAPWAINS
ncbi:hypothetical protein EQW76_19640 [Rhizobium sp. rho-13.1]|nr:ETC complex I subunit [Rhizobium sp. B21/90]TQX86007.1 hypothetical protein EQW76_19640 [Rhizobium sp. rho-13.1]TQY10971.1 hypothetical protein EQW74_18800 [Rhizobium sp. rho-1.1]